MNAYTQLENHFNSISHLNHLQAMASWDESVMMPSGGGKSRADALTTLQTLIHQHITDKRVGEWVTLAREQTLTPWQSKNVDLIEKQYINATCLPTELVTKLTKAGLTTEQAWRQYRPENNWKDFLPLLDETIKLTQESADIRAELFNKSPYDVLIDDFSPDLSQAIIDPIFTDLQNKLPAILQAILEKQASYTQFEGSFAIAQQKQLGLEIMQALGFDFNHGRFDVSHHPFCGGVPEDVRLTTRYNQQEFITALMGTAHETGHARYEQNLPKQWINQPVGQALGMSVHESQSLLIEMQACRSLGFMNFLTPLLKRHFGDQEAFTSENLYRCCTQVKPGLIRVDADEVTYPLHIILRYELEKALFNKSITAKDLPDLWNHKMETMLNLSTKGNFTDGVMQDVHWPAGLFGYFPAYTIGSLIAAQLFQQVTKTHPTLENEIAQGNFSNLFNWLNQNVHQHASSVSMNELLEKATGSTLNSSDFLQHIQRRYLG